MSTKQRITMAVCLVFILSMDVSMAQISKDLRRARNKWVHRINRNSKSLERLYLKQSLMILSDEVVFGQMPILQLVAEKRDLFERFSDTKSIRLYEHSDRKVLDVGTIYVEDDQKNIVDSLHYYTAWRKIGDDWLREVDIILPIAKTAPVSGQIDALRSAWVKFANGDNPDKLVNNLFTYDAMYLNNSELSRGQEDIMKRLAFMKDPAFHINLSNKETFAAGENTVADIGNWITNEFVGYYLILWKFENEDDWKIYLYFNF